MLPDANYEPGPGCPADLDDSGNVDGTDLSIILGYWGQVGTPYDISGDGVIGGADLTIILGSWGFCP